MCGQASNGLTISTARPTKPSQELRPRKPSLRLPRQTMHALDSLVEPALEIRATLSFRQQLMAWTMPVTPAWYSP